MWTVVVAWRLAFAASLFTVPVSPSACVLAMASGKKVPFCLLTKIILMEYTVAENF